MERVDDGAVQAFIDGFFGYGGFAAPVWFIGMEEGGGTSIGEIRRRIDLWRERGAQPLEDLVEFHRGLGFAKHLGAVRVSSGRGARSRASCSR